MQDMLSVATRFLQARKEWVELEREGRSRGGSGLSMGEAMRRTQVEAEMRSLAWVLDVDLDLMNVPKPADGIPDNPERIRLTHMTSLDCWLMEFPVIEEAGWRTEFWAAFLTQAQFRELAQAVMVALVPGARLSPDTVTGRRAPREKIVRLMASALPDVRYADDGLPPSA